MVRYVLDDGSLNLGSICEKNTTPRSPRALAWAKVSRIQAMSARRRGPCSAESLLLSLLPVMWMVAKVTGPWCQRAFST